jgi:hypothetical protein
MVVYSIATQMNHGVISPVQNYYGTTFVNVSFGMSKVLVNAKMERGLLTLMLIFALGALILRLVAGGPVRGERSNLKLSLLCVFREVLPLKIRFAKIVNGTSKDLSLSIPFLVSFSIHFLFRIDSFNFFAQLPMIYEETIYVMQQAEEKPRKSEETSKPIFDLYAIILVTMNLFV